MKFIKAHDDDEVRLRDIVDRFENMYYHNGVTPATPGLFANVESYIYYSGTRHFNSNPFVFIFIDGSESVVLASSEFHAWAVRDGDVASVLPEPGVAWLFGSALILLGWLERKAH